MTAWEAAARLLHGLERARLPHREAYVKRGRSRRVEISRSGATFQRREEEGWAVRAGTDRAAFFVAAAGEPPPRPRWPEPDGLPLDLPGVIAGSPWKPSPDLDVPLLVEGEAWTLLESVATALDDELPGARLAEASLEDGASEAWLVNGRGVRCEQRARAAALTLLAVLPAAGAGVHLLLAARAARRFDPRRLASRLATLLAARDEGQAVEHGRGECVLSPDLVARLVAGLTPLWLGREAQALAASLRDRGGRLASRHWTVVDNPRHDGLLCGEPVDGEGVPTREHVLVEEGRFREPLVDFRSLGGGRTRPAGCCRRPSWRDVPAPGASQLFLRPDARVRAADLVASVARGHYLLDGGRPARFHFVEDRFAVPVCGYALEKGQASGPIARTQLTGSIRALLHGVQAAAGDLELLPLGALYGGPTLLVTGLELRCNQET